MHGVPQCGQALGGNSRTTHKTTSMLIHEGGQLNAEPEDSVNVGFPNNVSPGLTCLDFQLRCMTVAANVVFQLMDRELLLDDQVPDEIAD